MIGNGGVGVMQLWIWWIPECFVVWVVARLWGWSGDGVVVVGLPLSTLTVSHSLFCFDFWVFFFFFFEIKDRDFMIKEIQIYNNPCSFC